MNQEEKRRRKALVAALPWDPNSWKYPGPWRLDRDVTAGVRTVVRFCRARGCRPVNRKKYEPCSRCDTHQAYGADQIHAVLAWTYRPEMLNDVVFVDRGLDRPWFADRGTRGGQER